MRSGNNNNNNKEGFASSLINEDIFNSLGTTKSKPKNNDRSIDPDKLQISSREINEQFKQGKHVDEYKNETKRKPTPGDAGSNWRMMKLKRVYEHSKEDNIPIDVLGIERFGSLEAFRDAQEERKILDQRSSSRRSSGRSYSYSRDNTPSSRDRYRDKGKDRDTPTRNLYTDNSFNSSDFSRPSSRSSFKRPSDTFTHTPTKESKAPTERSKGDRISDIKGVSKPSTPVPSVFSPFNTTPTQPQPYIARPKSPSSLNKMQAAIVKAKLMNKPNVKDLEMEYEVEVEKSNKYIQTGGDEGHGLMNVNLNDKTGLSPIENEQKSKVEVLPTLDGYGRLYDVGQGKKDGDIGGAGNKRKKLKNVDERDRRTGEILKYNVDDDDQSLAELVRQEKFSGGSKDQKNYDYEFANAISKDSNFDGGDLDDLDENASKYARKKMKTDAQKRQFAIGDFGRTKKALDTCRFCFGDNDEQPKCKTVLAMGTRVYLALPETEQLVKGHCLIVPIQHCLSTLEADDDVWEEIKNFMKCLMKAFSTKNQGVVFFETVYNIKSQLHTYIEAIPIDIEIFETLPAYFKESILSIESEWTQHRKLIDFSEKEFRKSLVPNLPYFAIMWNYKCNSGYGHVIEGMDDINEEDESESKYFDNSQKFPKYFAKEIIGNILQLEPRLWRRPKKLRSNEKHDNVKEFSKFYKNFDWTGLLN